MSEIPKQPALFISHVSSLSAAPGGVQRCTREYMRALDAAGFALEELPYVEDRRLLTRVRRRFFPRPYAHKLPPDLIERCLAAAERLSVRWIFINHGDPAPLAEIIHRRAPGRYRIAVLSHGLDSTDELHEARIRGEDASGARATRLGRQLFAEMRQRQFIDVVFCLSETDLQMERWLGARRVAVVPRTISESPLSIAPQAGRIGTVSTLNHPPNIEGIERLAFALAAHSDVKLRVVGGPLDDGEALARRFKAIEYVGPLDDDALRREASTWCCFVNPIFCYPRGTSTKLAVPLGWRLPIATTRAGARGYEWDERLIPLAETPQELAAQAARHASLVDHASACAAVAALAAATPSLPEIACAMRQVLASAETESPLAPRS
jgi:hypothetical protein